MNNDTVELILPQWQGGNNPNYQIGNEILATIVPKRPNVKRIHVPVDTRDIEEYPNGIDGEKIILRQMRTTRDILDVKQPKRIITLGGDCSISEAPFDYLNGLYDHLGIIWLDVHPDVANATNSHHAHEMVLANLLNVGADSFNKFVNNPFKPEQVMLAGLDYGALREMDQTVNQLSLAYTTPESLKSGNETILNWIEKNQIEHIAIHWDLDVLDPDDFRSIYPAEPHTNIEDFPAAVGKLTLNQVINLLTEISQSGDLVGLTIAEHLPWDAINLRNGLSQLSIFS